MKCAWQEFINLLPVWMRREVNSLGSNTLQELRLRLQHKPELVLKNSSVFLERTVTADDIIFCINTGSKYSPWTAGSISEGYITAPGGHRIGICGQATVEKEKMTGISVPTSLCIRVARDFCDISGNIGKEKGSILVIGKPGSGKTTFLRDLIRKKSESMKGSIGVVDQKSEIFPQVRGISCFPTGRNTDVMYNCSKLHGIEAILRNMGPSAIAVDEITAEEDCKALLLAGWCGVDLIATAHAGSLQDLYNRPVYEKIVESKLFDKAVVMKSDKSWYTERIEK